MLENVCIYVGTFVVYVKNMMYVCNNKNRKTRDMKTLTTLDKDIINIELDILDIIIQRLIDNKSISHLLHNSYKKSIRNNTLYITGMQCEAKCNFKLMANGDRKNN